MENPGRICTFTSGWLYYVNGEGVNACLMKVSTDGTKNILVASRFAKLVKVINGYIYYIATNGDLKFVRSDGTHDVRIAPEIEDLSRIIIDNEKVYYLKNDDFGNVKGNPNAVGYSLYSTDLYGKNLRKLSHDVAAMAEYNDDYIYICKTRGATYEVTTPVNRKLTNTEIQPADLTYYESYNRKTGEFKEIVRVGMPTTNFVTYKKSWWPFSRYITKESTVYEIDKPSDIYPNIRKNIAEVGMVEKEEALAEQKRLEEIKAAKEAKKKAKLEKRRAKLDKKLAKKAKKDEKRLNVHEGINAELDEFDKYQGELEEERKKKVEELKRVEEDELKLEEQGNATAPDSNP